MANLLSRWPWRGRNILVIPCYLLPAPGSWTNARHRGTNEEIQDYRNRFSSTLEVRSHFFSRKLGVLFGSFRKPDPLTRPKILTIQNSMGFKAAKLQNEAIVKKAERLGYKALCLTETWTQDGDSFEELAQLDDLIFECICSNPFTAILIISCLQSYLVFHFWILFGFLLASFEFDAYFHKKHKLEAERC